LPTSGGDAKKKLVAPNAFPLWLPHYLGAGQAAGFRVGSQDIVDIAQRAAGHLV
jgi:hypothetical protein